jgi:hypothetical protein
MNLDKDPESWARVSPVAVIGGSEAQRVNVLTMAKHDIAMLAAEVERLRSVVRVNGLRWGHSHAEIDKILRD